MRILFWGSRNLIYGGLIMNDTLEELIEELMKCLDNRYIGDSEYIESLEKDINKRM